MANSGVEWVDSIFDWAVHALVWLARLLGITYEEINIWVFVVGWPSATLAMLGVILWQWRKIRSLRFNLRPVPQNELSNDTSILERGYPRSELKIQRRAGKLLKYFLVILVIFGLVYSFSQRSENNRPLPETRQPSLNPHIRGDAAGVLDAFGISVPQEAKTIYHFAYGWTDLVGLIVLKSPNATDWVTSENWSVKLSKGLLGKLPMRFFICASKTYNRLNLAKQFNNDPNKTEMSKICSVIKSERVLPFRHSTETRTYDEYAYIRIYAIDDLIIGIYSDGT